MKRRRKPRRIVRAIHNRLRSLREENDLTQEQVADKVGVSKQAVSRWETGEGRPGIANAPALEKLYKLPENSLLDQIVDDIRAA